MNSLREMGFWPFSADRSLTAQSSRQLLTVSAHLDLEAVIGRLDMRWQFAAQRLVVETGAALHRSNYHLSA